MAKFVHFILQKSPLFSHPLLITPGRITRTKTRLCFPVSPFIMTRHALPISLVRLERVIFGAISSSIPQILFHGVAGQPERVTTQAQEGGSLITQNIRFPRVVHLEIRSQAQTPVTRTGTGH